MALRTAQSFLGSRIRGVVAHLATFQHCPTGVTSAVGMKRCITNVIAIRWWEQRDGPPNGASCDEPAQSQRMSRVLATPHQTGTRSEVVVKCTTKCRHVRSLTHRCGSLSSRTECQLIAQEKPQAVRLQAASRLETSKEDAARPLFDLLQRDPGPLRKVSVQRRLSRRTCWLKENILNPSFAPLYNTSDLIQFARSNWSYCAPSRNAPCPALAGDNVTDHDAWTRSSRCRHAECPVFRHRGIGVRRMTDARNALPSGPRDAQIVVIEVSVRKAHRSRPYLRMTWSASA